MFSRRMNVKKKVKKKHNNEKVKILFSQVKSDSLTEKSSGVILSEVLGNFITNPSSYLNQDKTFMVLSL